VAHTKFRVEVLTPEGQVFNDEVEQISTKTTTGSIGILAGHEPVLAMLDPTELRLYRSENEIERYAQAEGYMQVSEGEVLLLLEEAHRPDELDAAQLRDRLQEAERQVEATEEGSERRKVAEADKQRLTVFLEIAEGGPS
jgi:F-type H+-transporting ATPase subunit epsilon